jgi:hypothetical protein
MLMISSTFPRTLTTASHHILPVGDRWNGTPSGVPILSQKKTGAIAPGLLRHTTSALQGVHD